MCAVLIKCQYFTKTVGFCIFSIYSLVKSRYWSMWMLSLKVPWASWKDPLSLHLVPSAVYWSVQPSVPQWPLTALDSHWYGHANTSGFPHRNTQIGLKVNLVSFHKYSMLFIMENYILLWNVNSLLCVGQCTPNCTVYLYLNICLLTFFCSVSCVLLCVFCISSLFFKLLTSITLICTCIMCLYKVILPLKFPLSPPVLYWGPPRAYSKLMQVPHDSLLQWY